MGPCHHDDWIICYPDVVDHALSRFVAALFWVASMGLGLGLWRWSCFH